MTCFVTLNHSDKSRGDHRFGTFQTMRTFFAFWRPWKWSPWTMEIFLVLHRPCGQLSYSGDHRKGPRLPGTILGVWSRYNSFLCFWSRYNSLPPPAVTGYYWPPGHETFTFRPFTGETHRTQRESATFRLALFTTFFTAHHSFFKTVLRG